MRFVSTRGAESVSLDQALVDLAIEKGVAKDRDIIYPQEARFLYLWRALFPRLWWKTVMNYEK